MKMSVPFDDLVTFCYTSRFKETIKFYEEVDLQTSNWVRQVLERNLQLRRQVKLLDGLSEDVSEKTDP